jgi:hypothetical protein
MFDRSKDMTCCCPSWLNAYSMFIMLPFAAVVYEDAPVIVFYQSIIPADLIRISRDGFWRDGRGG